MACFDRDRFDGLQGEFCQIDVELTEQPRGEYEDLGWRDKGDCDKFSADPDAENLWFFPSYTTYGDYANTTLFEKSNYQVLLEACVAADQDADEVPDDCRPWFVTLSGGHDSHGIAVHIERAPDNIVEMLEGLSSDPLLDENHHDELEMEEQNKAWDETFRDDYRRALEKLFTAALEELAEEHDLEIDTDVDLSAVSDRDLDQHFWDWNDDQTVDWVNEDMSMWIDVEAVAKIVANELFTNPDAAPKGWTFPEGIPFGLRPVFVDPRQMPLPYETGFPERAYVPPPETRVGPAPLTRQEEEMINWMVRVGWYKKDDRAGLVAHIMRMRAEAIRRASRGGMNGFEGISAGELCARVRRAPTRSGLFDLASWRRRAGR